MKKIIGYIGLGKMGTNMVYRLRDKGWRVLAYNRSPEPRRVVARQGIQTVASLSGLIALLKPPRCIWLMVSHQAVESILDQLLVYTDRGDIIIDGGNSFFELSIQRFYRLKSHGVSFLDVGISGGPSGARNGACCMIGGEKRVYKKCEPLFHDISAPGGYGYMGGPGTGHFVKMVHNGIEYGMMQAIAEGFTLLKKSPLRLNVKKIADVYNHQSVIASRLMGWLKSAYEKYGVDLREISGKVAHSGEGQWTVETAKKYKISVPIIQASLNFRKQSQKKPSYTGQILSALRNQFGGHEVKKKPMRIKKNNS